MFPLDRSYPALLIAAAIFSAAGDAIPLAPTYAHAQEQAVDEAKRAEIDRLNQEVVRKTEYLRELQELFSYLEAGGVQDPRRYLRTRSFDEVRLDLAGAYFWRSSSYETLASADVERMKYQHLEKAIADLNKAIEYDPANSTYYYSGVELYARLGNQDRAMRYRELSRDASLVRYGASQRPTMNNSHFVYKRDYGKIKKPTSIPSARSYSQKPKPKPE